MRDRWSRSCARAGVPPDAIGRTWHAVVAAYGEASRRYHTLEHIGEVLIWIDRLAPDASPALELAAWLHDVVHDTTSYGNEAASAAWARERLAGARPDAGFDRMCALIEMTAHHDPQPDDHEATALADADLAILGAPPQRYARYSADVRAEYGHLDDAAWAGGRGRVLASLLDRPRLYRLPATGHLEATARRNLASELASLDRPGADPPQPGRA